MNFVSPLLHIFNVALLLLLDLHTKMRLAATSFYKRIGISVKANRRISLRVDRSLYPGRKASAVSGCTMIAVIIYSACFDIEIGSIGRSRRVSDNIAAG